ncbi:KNTC1 [Mytilus edulis]|uniref:KNTC1 n=1 Tax=Mytilus edulis TaxID=6550 RepID=A0A8S3TVU2_MYTED|nr:KNTC1 [Mytilus edulis]
MCKLRALHCLLELGEEKLLKDLVARSFDDLRELMKTLTYLVELEKLHILHSVETFQESNKEGLIKGIWRNHYHQKSAALLAAGMCLDFKVHEKQLWNGVLQQLLSFELMENLEYILMRLNSVPDVWQIAIYPKAWQTVLASPLTKVVAPLSSEQLETCVHSFNLLKRCPILHCLDMSVFVQHFLRLEMEVCALSCLLFSGEEESIQAIRVGNRAALTKLWIKFEELKENPENVKMEELKAIEYAVTQKKKIIHDLNEKMKEIQHEDHIEQEITDSDEYMFDLDSKLKQIRKT